MADEVKASVQHGDLKGSIAIDGWDGLATIGLADLEGYGINQGYWPIGISIYGGSQREGGELKCKVYILAVDCAILNGEGPESVRKYAREHGQLPVRKFATTIKPNELLRLIKRLSMVLQDRNTDGVQLVESGHETVYPDDVAEHDDDDI